MPPIRPLLRALALALPLGTEAAAPPPAALPRQPVLNLEVARTMVQACVRLAEQQGWRMNVAVADAGAGLLSFERMDRAFLGSVEVALDKARFSARFPFSTRFAGELAQGAGGQAPKVPGLQDIPGAITFAGGLPVTVEGVQVGGIGVSGGTPDEDERCAQAGLDAVQARLR